VTKVRDQCEQDKGSVCDEGEDSCVSKIRAQSVIVLRA
jgi:hypothetical protein